MPRYPVVYERKDGWSDWVAPVMASYKMSCCDCGLVHELAFQAVRVKKKLPDGSWSYEELDPEKHRVTFKARRHERATATARRRKSIPFRKIA